MYCKNCQLEIKDLEGTECPLCGSTLVEPSGDGAMADNAVGIDFDAMQDNAAAFVLDNEDSEAMEFQSQPAGEMDNSRTERPMHTPDQADHAQRLRTPALIDDATTDMLDQALDEYDPMVDEHFKVKKTGSKSTTILLLILLFVCVLGAGVYYYFFMMSEPAPPEPVAPVKIATPKKQDAVLDKVLRKEPAAPAPAQQAAVENATQESAKPEAVKPAQMPVKKPDIRAVAEQPVPETKPAEPAAALKPAEKPLQSDNKQPAAAIEKTEPSAAPNKAAAPAAVAVQEPARETAKAAIAEPAKKPAAPAAVAVQEPARETAKAAIAEPAKKPVAPAGAAVEKPAARTGQPVFSVLIGSFKSQSNAEAEVRRLSKLGYDVRAVEVDLKAKGLWHRVLIGSFKSRSEAVQMAEDVRRKSGKKDASVIVAE